MYYFFKLHHAGLFFFPNWSSDVTDEGRPQKLCNQFETNDLLALLLMVTHDASNFFFLFFFGLWS